MAKDECDLRFQVERDEGDREFPVVKEEWADHLFQVVRKVVEHLGFLEEQDDHLLLQVVRDDHQFQAVKVRHLFLAVKVVDHESQVGKVDLEFLVKVLEYPVKVLLCLEVKVLRSQVKTVRAVLLVYSD